MSDKIKKAIIAILILIIAGMGYYTYNQNKKHVAIESEMQIEKDNLLGDLTKLESQYDAEISKNTMLSEELTEQKNQIAEFKASIKKIKNSNWKLIKFYKNKIKDLNTISDRLIRKNDSLVRSNDLLNVENSDLNRDKDSLTVNLEKQTTYNNTLTDQNLDLAKKVAIGEIVKASNFSVTTYRDRKGSYKETDRARRVDAFKTSFVLNENPIAQNKDITAYVIIKNPNGELITKKGTFTTDNGESLRYSEFSKIPYKKATLASDILIKFGDVKLEKGSYTIDFYLEGKKVGTVKKTLK